MPELPEIEVLRRDLEKDVVGRRIKDVEVRPGSNAMKVIRRHGRRKEFQELLAAAKVERVDRRGRWLRFSLDNKHDMVIHLAERGVLLKTSASDELAPHTHIVLSFTIGGQLRLVDPDKHGEVFVAPVDQIAALDELRSTALDPLDSDNPVTWQHFSGILEQRASSMKKLLMDESFVVGLGSIYSDEVLFASGLRFDRQSDSLSSQDVRRLYRALMETLQEAVRARGTSVGEDAWRDLAGGSGEFQMELRVFDRDGQPCRRCRNQIEKAEWDGGTTYFCPQCQS
jgi:formamidopyrimidine-DNA glycosylase